MGRARDGGERQGGKQGKKLLKCFFLHLCARVKEFRLWALLRQRGELDDGRCKGTASVPAHGAVHAGKSHDGV